MVLERARAIAAAPDHAAASVAAGSLVAVTGADGFIGHHVCERWRAMGRPVRRLTRTLSPTDAARADCVACGDLADIDEARLATSLHGCATVVHLAGRAHIMRESAPDPLVAFRRANVEATRRVALAAVAAGVRHVVFASTVKVNGDSSPSGRPLVESDPPQPGDPYARSKWEAEQVLAAIAREHGLTVTILRLPLLYGPGVKGNFARLVHAVRRGVPLPLGAIANRRSLLFVGNFASALDAVLQLPLPASAGTRTWFVADAPPVGTAELVRALAHALGREPRLFPMPQPALHAVARMLGKMPAYERLAGSLEVDTSALRAATGWSPPYTMAEGLAETVIDCYAPLRRRAS